MEGREKDTESIVSRFSVILVGKVFIKVTATAELFEIVAKAFDKVIQTAENFEVKNRVPFTHLNSNQD